VKTELIVNTGQICVAHENEVLEALGVGSCVIVCLYDKEKHLGGMAHVMLPVDYDDDDINSPAEIAAEGIQNLLVELRNLGAKDSTMEAKLAGGAEMFKKLSTNEVPSVGSLNVAAVTEALNFHGIPIVSADTGGTAGRSVRFYVSSGALEVRKKI
jgi:chemotaxis protein CheD